MIANKLGLWDWDIFIHTYVHIYLQEFIFNVNEKQTNSIFYNSKGQKTPYLLTHISSSSLCGVRVRCNFRTGFNLLSFEFVLISTRDRIGFFETESVPLTFQVHTSEKRISPDVISVIILICALFTIERKSFFCVPSARDIY